MINVESRARAMSKIRQRAYLREHGWIPVGHQWLHPTDGTTPRSLGAAIRAALAEEP